jgi:hypothetical protein
MSATPDTIARPSWRRRRVKLGLALAVVGLVGYGVFAGVQRVRQAMDRTSVL